MNIPTLAAAMTIIGNTIASTAISFTFIVVALFRHQARGDTMIAKMTTMTVMVEDDDCGCGGDGYKLSFKSSGNVNISYYI